MTEFEIKQEYPYVVTEVIKERQYKGVTTISTFDEVYILNEEEYKYNYIS